MKSFTVMQEHYGFRYVMARPIITISGIYEMRIRPHLRPMLAKMALLERLESQAKSRAEMSRVLGIAASRVSEMFKGERDLSYEEARKLCQHYNVEMGQALSVEALVPILAACLRTEPRSEWSDADVQRLAEEIQYGLQLMNTAGTNPPSQDVIGLAARVAADRLRGKPGSA